MKSSFPMIRKCTREIIKKIDEEKRKRKIVFNNRL